MRIKTLVGAGLVAGAMTVSSVAGAAWTVDDAGNGFVGKGDVQTVLDLNNKALQDNAAQIDFRVQSSSVTTWSCTNTNNDNIQNRQRSTSTQGVVSAVGRERNQVTGFNLNGFVGAPTVVTEGNQLNSCPTNWQFNNDTATVPAGGGLQVRLNGGTWHDLP